MHIVRILRYLFDYVTSNLLTDSLLEYQWCVYKLVSHVWTSLRRPVVPRFSASRKVSPALSSYTVLQALLNEPVHPAKNGHHGAYWQCSTHVSPCVCANEMVRSCVRLHKNVREFAQTYMRFRKRSCVGANVPAFTQTFVRGRLRALEGMRMRLRVRLFVRM